MSRSGVVFIIVEINAIRALINIMRYNKKGLAKAYQLR